MMIGPGMSRALGVYYHIPFAASISDIFYLETTLAAAFLLSDILRKKSYKVNLIILSAKHRRDYCGLIVLKRRRRIDHNLPQESAAAFALAIIDLDRF